MQILTISRPDFSLFCPFTGESILNEEESSLEPIKLPSVQAIWIDEVIDTPEIESKALRQAWEQAAPSVFDATDLPKAMSKFLSHQDLPDHIAINFYHDAGIIKGNIWIVLAEPKNLN